MGKRELGLWAQVPCSSHSLLICCVISKSLSFLEAQFSLLRGNVTALLSGLLRRRGEVMWKLRSPAPSGGLPVRWGVLALLRGRVLSLKEEALFLLFILKWGYVLQIRTFSFCLTENHYPPGYTGDWRQHHQSVPKSLAAQIPHIKRCGVCI